MKDITPQEREFLMECLAKETNIPDDIAYASGISY
jgi:hypothetical protein